MQRFQSLDGWRGISILFVLAGHLFPLGPSFLKMNGAIAATGMAIFFILSGFLITSMLLKDSSIKKFITRRFMRIVPLAWLVAIFALILNSSPINYYLSHLFFYANWEPISLTYNTAHFWSLCVEMQFYLLVAFLVILLKKKVFFVLPILCIIVTIARVENAMLIDIKTYYRLDEILAGCVLALMQVHGSTKLKTWLGKLNPIVLLILLILSAHAETGALNFLRPYFAMLLIASTLFSDKENRINNLLNHKYLIYLATISYALYLIHGVLASTWLGHGEIIEKYLKRPLLLAITFLLAHFSTFYYEKYWIDLGKRITSNNSDLKIKVAGDCQLKK